MINVTCSKSFSIRVIRKYPMCGRKTREVALYFYNIYRKIIITLHEVPCTRRFAPTRGAPLSRNTADASTYTVAFLDISIAT